MCIRDRVITASDDNTETGDVAQNMESAVSHMEINASMTMNKEMNFVNGDKTTTTISGDSDSEVGPVINFKKGKHSIPTSCMIVDNIPSKREFDLVEWRNNVLKPTKKGESNSRSCDTQNSFLGRQNYQNFVWDSETYSGTQDETYSGLEFSNEESFYGNVTSTYRIFNSEDLPTGDQGNGTLKLSLIHI